MRKVLSLITLQLGNEMMVSVQAEMQERSSSRELIEDINRIEIGMKERFPNVRWSFFEPDFSDAEDQDYAPVDPRFSG